jgi:diguanylate cyclase (GGDEF)-like protein/PAS domain S-box-containing protein
MPERSWQRYRLIADTTTDVVYESDSAGIIQWISPSVHELLGWAPIQLQGRPASDLIHPLDRDRIEALRASFYLDGSAHDDVTCMVSTAAGGYRELRLTTRPLLDAQGTVIGTIVTVTDTHDRDSALRALATLSQANRTLVRATDETTLLQQMCETIVGTGRYLFAWYGRPVDDAQQSVQPIAIAGEHQGYLDEIRISWGDNPLGRGPSGRAIRTRHTQVENDFQPDPEYQPWLKAATSRGFRSSIVLPIIVGDELDGVLMVYAAEAGAFDALAQDLLEDLAADLGYGMQRLRAIRERDVAVERLTESEHQFRLLAVNSSDVIMLSTADMTITWVSPSAEQAFGYSIKDIVGRNASFLIHPDDLPHVVAEVQRTDATKTNLHVRHRLVHADGHAYWVDVVAGHIDDNGTGSPGRVVSIRDVDAQALAEEELAAREVQYRLLAENSSDVILLSDQDTLLTWVSSSSLQTLGWRPDELLGSKAVDYIHPDDQPALQEAVARSTVTGESIRPQYRWRRPDGSYRWMEAAGRPITDDGSGRPGRVVSLRDVEAQVRAEQELAAREERYRLLAENASDVVWQVAPDGSLEWTSPSITRVLGWTPEEVLGTVAMDLVDPDDRERATQQRQQVLAGRPFDGEFRIRRADGRAHWMALTVHPVSTPAGVTRILALRDIQDEVSARTQLEFALGHDRSTGLPEREGMIDRIAYVQSLLSEHHVLAVLCIGIDALREVNEALGHSAGDIVLRSVAGRIAESSRNPELVGRSTGDEFIVIIPDLEVGADAAPSAEVIRTKVHGAITIADHEISPTVSIGIAIGDRTADPEGLLRDAGLAPRRAKENGRDRFAFVNPSMSADAETRLALETAIREGLRTGEFVPWFQPITSLVDGRVDGFEALARWSRPDGITEPAGFIPVAAHTGLLTEIDLAMVEPVAAALAGLPEPLFIAVNVSGQTLARTAYADVVAASLTAHSVTPSRLHIEITETTLLSLNDDVVRQMHELAELGCRWYIDDFGTGYSSISHLRDLPVAGLKLDMTFTSGIGAGDRTSMQLAGALIGLANGMGLDTVAEGIESQAEADYLRTLGWRHGQGWLYGKATPTPTT